MKEGRERVEGGKGEKYGERGKKGDGKREGERVEDGRGRGEDKGREMFVLSPLSFSAFCHMV